MTHHLSPNSYVMTTNDDTFMHPVSMVAGHDICDTNHDSDDVVRREVNFCGLLQDDLRFEELF